MKVQGIPTRDPSPVLRHGDDRRTL